MTDFVTFDDLLEPIEQRLLLFRTHLLNLRKTIKVQRSLLNQRSLPSLRSRLSLVEGLLVVLLRCTWPDWLRLDWLLSNWVIPIILRLGSLNLDVVWLELSLRRLVSDWRCANRVVLSHESGILHLLIEHGHVLAVLVNLRVRTLHRWRLTPDLVLRQVHLVETRLLLLRMDLVLWVGVGLSGPEAWVLVWELLAIALSLVLVNIGSPDGLLGQVWVWLLPRHLIIY